MVVALLRFLIVTLGDASLEATPLGPSDGLCVKLRVCWRPVRFLDCAFGLMPVADIRLRWLVPAGVLVTVVVVGVYSSS